MNGYLNDTMSYTRNAGSGGYLQEPDWDSIFGAPGNDGGRFAGQGAMERLWAPSTQAVRRASPGGGVGDPFGMYGKMNHAEDQRKMVQTLSPIMAQIEAQKQKSMMDGKLQWAMMQAKLQQENEQFNRQTQMQGQGYLNDLWKMRYGTNLRSGI